MSSRTPSEDTEDTAAVLEWRTRDATGHDVRVRRRSKAPAGHARVSLRVDYDERADHFDVAIQQALERYACSLAWCRVRQRCLVKDVGLGDGSRAPVSIEAGAAGWL